MHKVATPEEYLVSGKEQHAMWGKCMHEIKDRNRPVSQWQRYDCGCLCSVMPAGTLCYQHGRFRGNYASYVSNTPESHKNN